MLNDNRIQLQSIRSMDVLSGSTADAEVARHFGGENSPKLPDASILGVGEIALNIAKDYETVSIKNSLGEIVFLPFNLASRVLALEGSVSSLASDISEQIPELSASTEQTRAALEAFKTEIQNRIDDEARRLTEGYTTLISETSASTVNLIDETNDRIDSLEERTNERINEATGAVRDEIIRLLQQNVESLDGKIDLLSAHTDSEVSRIDEKIDGVQQTLSSRIDSEIQAVESKIDTKAGEVGEHAENRLQEVKTELQGEIESGDEQLRELISHISGGTDVDVEQLKQNVEALSAQTQLNKEGIEAVDTTLNDKIDTAEQSLRQMIGAVNDALSDSISDLNEVLTGKITSASSESESRDGILSDRIDALSGSTESLSERISEVSGASKEYTDTQVQAAVALTDDTVGELRQDLGQRIDSIDESLGQRIDSVRQDVVNVDSELKSDISSLSASTDEKIHSAVTRSDNAVSTLGNELGGRIDELESGLNSKIDNVEVTVGDAVAGIREEVGTLSADTEESIRQTKEELERKIEEATSGSSGDISGKIDEINQRIDTLSGETENGLGDANARIDELSAKTTQEVDELHDIADTINTKLDITTDNLARSIENLSADTEDRFVNVTTQIADAERYAIDESVAIGRTYTDETANTLRERIEANTEEINSLRDEAREYTDQKTEGLADGIAQNRQSIENLSGNTSVQIELINEALSENRNDISSLSAETESFKDETAGKIDSIESKVANLKIEDLSDVEVTDISKSAGDIEILVRDGDIWKNSKVGLASKDEFGLVKIGSGLTVDNGVVSATFENVDQRVISGSTNPVSGGAVYTELSRIENTTEAKIEVVSATSENAMAVASGVSENFSVLESETFSALTDMAETISACSEEFRSEIDEMDLVHAAAFARLNTSLGFTENAIYSATSENLQGRSVSDALDYLDEKIVYVKNINGGLKEDLLKKLLEDELVWAGFAARMNYSLGFDENATYIPETPILTGRSVTEAIDLMYGRFGESIEEIVSAIEELKAEISGHTHLMRTITYGDLVQKRNEGKLQWGMLYRLTNYQATIDESESILSENHNPVRRLGMVDPTSYNANNGFDILIRAISNETLDENVWFMKAMNGDNNRKEYFEDNDVQCWKGKYTIDNDKTRFSWADENGYGVIYHMQDEKGNEAPYDFKNIGFGTSAETYYTFGTLTNESYDITKETGNSYASVENAIAAVPSNKRRGGMYISFRNSSTSSYETWHLKKDTWSAVTSDWEYTPQTSSNMDSTVYSNTSGNILKPAYNENGVQILNGVYTKQGMLHGNRFAEGCEDIIFNANDEFNDNIFSSSYNDHTNITSAISHKLAGYTLA